MASVQKSIRLLWPALLAIAATDAFAGVTLDGSMGTSGALSGSPYNITAAMGRQVGGNLFHSFGSFSLLQSEIARFTNAGASGAIGNVIARVTGGAASSIDGTLDSSGIPGANLYFVNPSGIVFGAHAALNVSGSFYASTANYLKFADGSRLDAGTPAASVLTAAAPAAFGFLGAPAAITVQSTGDCGAARGLCAQQGSVGLLGGDITFSGGAVSAPSGKIYLGSAAGAGEIAVSAGGLDVSTLTKAGNVSLNNASLTTTEAAGQTGGGGSIFIRAGQIVTSGGAIEAQTVNGNGGSVDLAATGDISLSAGKIETLTTGQGRAGAVLLAGRRIALANGAIIDSSNDPGSTGDGNNIQITATESFAIAGKTDNSGPTGLASNASGPGQAGSVAISAPVASMTDQAVIQSGTTASGITGAGGVITLNVGSLSLSGGAQLDSSTRSSGAGGAIRVHASGDVSISGTQALPPGQVNPIASGLSANAYGSGAGGQIEVDAANLRLTQGGEISSTSHATASPSATGGSVSIVAAGEVLVSGQDANAKASAIVANTFGPANAGAVSISAQTVSVDQAYIQSVTQGSGRGGEITITAASVDARNGGQISASAFSSGDGGAVTIAASQGVRLAGAASGIFARTEIDPQHPLLLPAANGGRISVSTPAIAISDGAGVFAISGGTGRGGDIRISAGDVELAGGGKLSSQAFFSGDAGNVSVTGAASVRLDGGSITTEARAADGGNILVQAAELVSLNYARITATVGGVNGAGGGNGGNIVIDPQFVTLNHSDIIANAIGGNGGNISIITSYLFQSPDSVISASSQFGLSGTVVIQSQATDLSGGLRALRADYLNLAALLGERCAARLAGRTSSLVLAGRGALPVEPGTPLPAVVAQPGPAGPLANPGNLPRTTAAELAGLGPSPGSASGYFSRDSLPQHQLVLASLCTK